jgi:hypothetical protein
MLSNLIAALVNWGDEREEEGRKEGRAERVNG